MNAQEILAELKPLASDSTKKTLLRHGAKEPFYGVKIEELKKFQKRIKKDHELSLALYDTGVSDAMYLAGLIADENKITKKDLQHWLKKAPWHMISEYTVPWIAAESKYGWELGLEWIESKDESVASAGWATLSSLVAIKKDEELKIAELKKLLKLVEKNIHSAPNRVRYTMNGFVISTGGYVKDLTETALQTGKTLGTVMVDFGDTACKLPYAPDYINKMKQKGVIGKKKKMARC